MSGRVFVSLLLGVTTVFAAVLWYFQVYAYYEPVTLSDAPPVQVSISAPVAGDADLELPSAGGNDQTTSTLATPSTLQPATGSSETGVDNATLEKPSVGGADDQDDPPAEVPVAQTDTQSDGTTPSDPDAASSPEIVAGETSAPKLPGGTNDTADAPEDDIVIVALPNATSIRLTRVWDNQPEIVDATNFEGIDANTSPLKFKGCFSLPNSIPMMTEAYVVYDDPTPLKAPIWFSCYRHKNITQALESGEAVAFLGEANITYGVDRVVAVFDDGRSFVWHQINHCGTAAFAGDPLPADCPPQPER